MGFNRRPARKKCVTIALSEDEWQSLADYGNKFQLKPTEAARRLIKTGILFDQ